ncbi:LPXTG cell wall anchor domain-containing protein [Weissella viridescens]|uniref:LPXTG cell wall anchor domain-containing protein n=1 Tax=Weissella viridescens TaxID=1629 RepID=A0A3P2RK96_WEIVI|nr:LPXTG cell wall anchor domain-containing protein [Weissella viridescens]RRG18092.1 LPXTG cell wall anchor domain-containing protein [Weissella viridescens]
MNKNIKLYSITLAALLGVSVTTVAHADEAQQTNPQPQTEQVTKAPVTTDVSDLTGTAVVASAPTNQPATTTPTPSADAQTDVAKTVAPTADTTATSTTTDTKTTPSVQTQTPTTKPAPATNTPAEPEATSKVGRSNTDGQWHGKTIKMLNGTTWYFSNGRVLDDDGNVVAYVGNDGTLITDSGEKFAELQGQYIIDGSGAKIGELFTSTVAPRFVEKENHPSTNTTNRSDVTTTTPATPSATPSAKVVTQHSATLPDTGYEKNQSIITVAAIALVALIAGLANHLVKYRH